MAKYSVGLHPPTHILHGAAVESPSREESEGASPARSMSLNAKQLTYGLKEQRKEFQKAGLTANLDTFIEAQFFMRRQILDILLDPRHKIDQECGYPTDITPILYKLMYGRDGLSKRVVELLPKESWKIQPEVFETHDPDVETAFEQAWEALVKRLNVWPFLKRADILSGIGRFGVVLLGLDDGRDMSEPVDGIDDMGEKYGDFQHSLVFLRTFDETVARVNMRESNTNNPRFGKPTMYTLTFKDLDITELAGSGIATVGDVTKRVHWTRVLHLADNREMSDIYGCPRMKPVFNRLMDVRKVAGGSAEMFWKGAFPGISFELMPGIGDAEVDQAALQQQMTMYSSGLQRFIALTGMTAKSLSPQIADPEKHLDAQLKLICIALGVPMRVFQGVEEAKLASSQDAKGWNMRLREREVDYLSPMVICPFVDRLIAVGVLPEPEEYEVYWEDLNTASDTEKAAITLQKAQALAAYVSSGANAVMGPADFLEEVMGLERDKVDEILKKADVDQLLDDEDEDGGAPASGDGTGAKQPAKKSSGSAADGSQKAEDTAVKNRRVRVVVKLRNSAGGGGNETEKDPFDLAAQFGGASRPEKKRKGPKRSGEYRDKYKAAKPPNKKSGGPGIAPTVTSMLEEASSDQATKP